MVTAYYFLKEVEAFNRTANKIRADLGSRNSYVYGIQTFFRRNNNDEFSGNKIAFEWCWKSLSLGQKFEISTCEIAKNNKHKNSRFFQLEQN